MSKFYEQGSLLGEIHHMRQLVLSKKRLDQEIKSGYLVHARKASGAQKDKFCAHPKRICSDSDTTIENSPRRLSLSSSASNIELNRSFEENKTKIKNTRKKLLHRKLTRTTEKRDQNEFAADSDIGDTGTHPAGGDDHLKAIKNTVPVVPNKTKVPQRKSSKVFVLTDSMFEKKFKVFVEKSLHVISDIRSLMEKGIDLPDGNEDISRRMLRVKEFSNRFSRNYLYPIVRQLDDLSRTKSCNLNQKLLSCYQIILNGLQAYQNHLPTSIGGCSSDKLKLLLKHLLELCDIHSKSLVNKDTDEDNFSDFINAFKLNAELTLQKIEDHFRAVSTDSVLKSTTTKISLPNQRTGNQNKAVKSKKSIEDRLSMYSNGTALKRDQLWRKTAENLARNRLVVKSKYKTALFRHRPPIEKTSQILSFPSKCKLFSKKSSTLLTKTPLTTPVNEDNIMTMVEIERNTNKHQEYDNCGLREQDYQQETNKQQEHANHQDMVVRLLQLVLNAAAGGLNTGPAKDDANATTIDMKKVGAEVETLKRIIAELSESTRERLELKVVACSEDEDAEIAEETAIARKKRKEPVVTVTGPKNAKLICIKDDNSIEEQPEEVEDSEIKDCQTEKNPKAKHTKNVVSFAHTQDEDHVEDDKATVDNYKSDKTVAKPSVTRMRRAMKTFKLLKMLPKQYAVNVIQYKLDFHKYCKTDPMYRRTESVVPWKLMGKISDEILDFALLGVAREIELNDLVGQIYQSELQM